MSRRRFSRRSSFWENYWPYILAGSAGLVVGVVEWFIGGRHICSDCIGRVLLGILLFGIFYLVIFVLFTLSFGFIFDEDASSTIWYFIGGLALAYIVIGIFGGNGKENVSLEENTSPAPEILGDVYVCSGCGKEYIDQFPYTAPWEEYPTEVTFHEIIEVGETYRNGSIGRATPVAMFQRVTGNLASRDDVDFFSFTLDVPGRVDFCFSYDGSSGGYTYLWEGVVYGTDGTTALNSENVPIKEGEEVHFGTGESDLEPGTYYLKISVASGGNPLMSGYSDTDYHITFRPKCKEHTSVTQFLTAAPTCSKEGKLTTICNMCDEQISTESLEPLDHIWSTWKTVEKISLSSFLGERSRICALCGETETSSLLFHLLDGAPKTDPEAVTVTETWTEHGTASCVSEGFAKTVCSVCGNVEVERKEATGHTYGEWVTIRAATCLSEGQRSHTCTACGYVETETLDCIPHAYGEAVYISGSILDAPIVSQEICTECGYVNTVESGWFWWIRPAIIILAAAGISAFLIGAKNSLLTPEKKVIKSIFVSGAVEGLIITILTMVMSFRVDEGDNPFLFLLVLPMCLVVIVVTTILLCKITGTDVNNRIIFTIVVRFVISLGASVIIFSCFGGSNEDSGVHWTCLR